MTIEEDRPMAETDNYCVYVVNGWTNIGWITRWNPPLDSAVSFDFRAAKRFDAKTAYSISESLNRFGILNGVFTECGVS